MNPKITWTEAQPDSISLDQVLYQLRRMDGADGLLLDSVTMAEIMEDTDGVIALDALVVENAQLTRMAERLRAIMDRSGGAVKAPAVQVSEPFRARGVTNIAAVFELSDGQTVSVFFHNPDTAPNKLAPGDEMISWKWLLNKKDITIVVAPEKGQDLNPRLVASRIMKLAEKNSPAFQKANAKRSERMGNIEAIRGRIVEKEATLNELVAQVEAARLEKSQKTMQQEDANAATREEVKKWLEGSGYAVKDAAMSQYTKTIGDRIMLVSAARLQLVAAVLDSTKLLNGQLRFNTLTKEFQDALVPSAEGDAQPAMDYAAGFEAIKGFVEGREREGVTVLPEGEGEAAAEVGPFGRIFAGFTNNPEGAIEVLMAEKEGEVADAFIHHELGPIAFIYGDESMGLRHIESKRGIQWVRRIPEILRAGRVERDPKLPRAYIVDDANPASVTVIRLDWDGQQKAWLVTAHPDDIGKWSGSGKTSGTTGEESGQVQGNPSLPNPLNDSNAKVDAAYQFANATAAFKERVAGSIDKTDYSEFATVKAMDMKAKELGAEIHWGMGAALDSVQAEEGEEDDFDPESEFDACPVWQEEDEEVAA